ncbi:zinc finger protein 583-like [Sitodiplosis mosellana]|uniref:zinc finger protein 583-like n=1 Tax=Sitodiplosis mosellana TaxID=263140 RepID=UPI00244435D9|nr:zinc finger protein 583-like [Sitodiplosis mosellana]
MTTQFSEDFNNLAKICRCCLCKNGEMRPLFGSCLDNMLSFVADIDVHANDGLPKLMCVPCVLQVSRAFTFKQQCRRSDQSLKSFLGKLPPASDNNHIEDGSTSLRANNVMQPKVENVVVQVAALEDGMKEHTFQLQSNETETDNLDAELVLDVLTSEIETSSFEEEIELSSLPSETQFSPVASENIQQQLAVDGVLLNDVQGTKKENLPQKSFGVYFDEIKLDVAQVSLTDETFDDIPADESDVDEKKMSTDEFICDILSDDKLKTGIRSSFKCTNCDLHFETEEKLDTHMQSSHTTDTNTSDEAKDANKNETKNSFECPDCHKVFAEKKILKRHLKIHSPIKPHTCPHSECGMSFAESSNLSKHMKKHTGELRNVIGKPNLCQVCGKGFKWASSLSKHMKHHTRHKILNCPYCPKYYVEARSLNIHMRYHTGEKPFVCEVCKKGFTQMGNLEKHIRIHTGEKPFKCPICSKGFSQSGYVAIHLRTHTGEKPYRCDVENCGRAFAGSNTLAIHKRTHSGERPYPCSHSSCDKTFARQETANIHQRTHTGEKPYRCEICHRGFTSSGHLTGHIRSHSGTKTHECKCCKKRFAGSSSLKVHMKSHSFSSEKASQQQQQQQEQQPQPSQQQIFDTKTTVFECNMCKMNIPSSALSSTEELPYNHELIDDVLICSNVASIIDNGKIIEGIHDENGTNIILTTTTHIENGQQLLINLSDLK